MDFGLGIRMIHPLAAQEASAGGAVEIEPGHLLCAALQLAELPVEVFQNVLPADDLVSFLVAEQRGLCTTLNALNIRVPDDSTLLRRSLRRVLRKATHASGDKSDGVMHRSAACKALFARVATEAVDAGDQFVAINRFVETIMAEPDAVLIEALTQVGIVPLTARSTVGRVELDWINSYGFDLTEAARKENAASVRVNAVRRDAACRVLVEAMVATPGSYTLPLLLVSHGERRAATVMRDLACWIVSANPPAGTRNRCVVEFSANAILDDEHELRRKLEHIFRQAAAKPETILFIDDFQRYLAALPSADAHWERWVQSLLRASKNLCVLGMTSEHYKTNVENAGVWQNIFNPIFIHEVKPDFQL